MRVLLDANIFISYLLPTKDSEKQHTIHAIVDAGFESVYTIVFPKELLTEMRIKVKEKPYLTKYITQSDAEEFIELLKSVAELLPPMSENIPTVTRDKKDDYLLAYAMVGECDYLVSGDRDLKVIKQVEQLKIVSPAEFYKIIKQI